MLDQLRGIFVYAVALVLPAAGAILAIVRLVEGDRDEALRLAIAVGLGLALYALLFV